MGGVLSSYEDITRGPASTASADNSRVKKYNSSEDWKSDYNGLKESNRLVVIHFSAWWCGPSKFIEPAVRNMSKKYTNVDFVEIDVDDLSDVAQEFDVQAMPTFVLIKGKDKLGTVIGAKKNDLETMIEKHR